LIIQPSGERDIFAGASSALAGTTIFGAEILPPGACDRRSDRAKDRAASLIQRKWRFRRRG
jgi:hypothetical protein